MATLWYNGDSDGRGGNVNSIDNSGINNFAIFMFEDFTVPNSQTWNITEIWSNNFNAPSPSTTAFWSIRTGMSPDNGGTVLFSGISPVTQTLTGRFRSMIEPNNAYIDPEYQFKISGLNINLAPGTYWLQVTPYSSSHVGISTTSGTNSIGTSPTNKNNALWKSGGDDPSIGKYERVEGNFSMGVGNDVGKQPPAIPPIPVFTAEGIIFVLSPNSDRVNLRDYPGANNKFVLALDGDDFIQGTAGVDSINGNQGNDEILGGQGDDFILGGKGNDFLNGNEGNDTINGNRDDDVVRGGKGNDVLNGGQGNDLVLGDEGDDILSGDFGTDTLIGGQGNDVFFLRADGNEALGLMNTAKQWQLADIIIGFNTPNLRPPRPTPSNDTDKIVINNGLSFRQLAFEAINVNVNGTLTRPATAIRIASNGEYLGVLVDVNPDELRPEDFITVN